MLTVPRARRGMSAVLVSLALLATVLVPIGGVASAASGSTTCPTVPSEGSPIPTCILVITTTPVESVLTNVPFTVQVAVTSDGTTVAKNDPCGSTVQVTLFISNGFGGALNNQYFYANAVAGIATFQITIPPGTANDGLYSLDAYVQLGGDAPVTTSTSTPDCTTYNYVEDVQTITAVTIPADQPLAPCPDNTVCVQAGSGSGSGATLIAEDGIWTVHQFGATPPVMAGVCPTPATGADQNGTLQFDNPTSTTEKTIVLTLRKDLVTKGIGQFKICWSGNTAFTPPGGTVPVLTGFLPACSKKVPAPCVLFQKSNQLNTGFFGVLAPPGNSGLGADPYVKPT